MRSESQTHLLMQREDPPSSIRHDVHAGIKTILLHVHDDDFVMQRLQLALSVARACGAHVQCLHVMPLEAHTVVDVLGGAFVNEEIVSTFEKQASSLRRRIEAQLAIEDVTWDYEERTGGLLPSLVQASALADLVMIGRETRHGEFGASALAIIGDMLTQIRAPLMVLGDRAGGFDPFAPAVIAWNGSYEAANAVRGALPLLRMASTVTVVEFSEERQRRFPSIALLEYLSRHGISAELHPKNVSGDIADALTKFAERQAAELIVMGAYSHRRVGEFLFGGVTRSLLKECPISLIMAH